MEVPVYKMQEGGREAERPRGGIGFLERDEREFSMEEDKWVDSLVRCERREVGCEGGEASGGLGSGGGDYKGGRQCSANGVLGDLVILVTEQGATRGLVVRRCIDIGGRERGVRKAFTGFARCKEDVCYLRTFPLVSVPAHELHLGKGMHRCTSPKVGTLLVHINLKVSLGFTRLINSIPNT